MDKFKIIVDVLSSIASFVAIVTVLYSWRISKLPPLKVSQLIISPKQNRLRVFIRISNRKLYPVVIKSITCYKKQKYQINKKKLERPQLWPSTDVSDKLFTVNEEVEISELGQFSKEVYIDASLVDAKSLLFSVHTSHGFLRLKCKNVYTFDKEYETYQSGEIILKNSKFTAWFVYIKAYTMYLAEIILNKFGLPKTTKTKNLE